MISALLEVGREAGFVLRQERLVGRNAGGVFVRILPDGTPAVVLAHPGDQRIVHLIPERSYGASGDLRSITFSQRPDIAVEVRSAAGETGAWLFDPKYKLDGELLDPSGPPGPKKVDIDKMHAYRDAIRDDAGERVVQYAAILYPGPERIYRGGIEALSGDPENPTALECRLRDVLTSALISREPTE